jgi:hypothetical protein
MTYRMLMVEGGVVRDDCHPGAGQPTYETLEAEVAELEQEVARLRGLLPDPEHDSADCEVCAEVRAPACVGCADLACRLEASQQAGEALGHVLRKTAGERMEYRRLLSRIHDWDRRLGDCLSAELRQEVERVVAEEVEP